MIASCGFLEDLLCQCSKEEGVTMADSVEMLGVDLRTRVKKLGAKEKSEKEEVQSEILARHEEQGLPQELHEGGGQETATCGHDTSKDLGSPCSGDGRQVRGPARTVMCKTRDLGMKWPHWHTIDV